VDFFVLILVMLGLVMLDGTGGVRVVDFDAVVADSSHDDDGISATASNFLNADLFALNLLELPVCTGRLRERLSRK
jgi:hypothetical protein